MLAPESKLPQPLITEPAEPMVVVESVRKSFHGNVVLDSVDLVVPPGQMVALIGRSGSGKTTLLRTLNGLEEIDEGRITVGGIRIQDRQDGGPGVLRGRELSIARTHIGFVFQQYNLFPHLSVIDNIVVAQVTVLCRSTEEARQRGLQLLDRVGLREKAESRPSQLSGGQQQRVAIARTLAMDPSVILLDEITSALDPEMTAEVLQVVKGLGREGITLIVVTHEMNFARHADRVVFMSKGRITEDGPPAAVLDRPRHPDTVAFLASVTEDDDDS